MPAGRPLRDRSLLFEQCEDTIASCDELRDLARSLNAETAAELSLVQSAIAASDADQILLLSLEQIELRQVADEDGISRVVDALLRATHDILRRADCLHLWPEFQAEAAHHLATALKVRRMTAPLQEQVG